MRIKEYELSFGGDHSGIRTYHSVLPPQSRPYNAHHHTQCELSVFLAGEGEYTVGKTRYPFCAGDIFLFGSNEEHCITKICAPIDLLNVQFEPFLLWESSDTMEISALFNARTPDFENRLTDEEGRIKEYLTALEAELRDKRPCHAVIARSLLLMALTAIIRSDARIDHERAIKLSENVAQSLRAVIDYIQRNLDARLTLGELAGVACLSPNYFSCVFKKYNGISLWEYIAIKRVERAVEMLKSTRLTKLEIAERCGFSCASNFYKTFAAVTGKTPSDFIKLK